MPWRIIATGCRRRTSSTHKMTEATLISESNSCEFHCFDSWLPIDGETDRIPYERHRTVNDDGIDESEALHILWPTEWTACVCNPLYSMNNEITCATVDERRA